MSVEVHKANTSSIRSQDNKMKCSATRIHVRMVLYNTGIEIHAARHFWPRIYGV